MPGVMQLKIGKYRKVKAVGMVPSRADLKSFLEDACKSV